MLNFMSSDFAKSPAYFNPDSVSADWMFSCIVAVFPCFHEIGSIKRILQQCLASLIHHRDQVMAFEPNHPARNSIDIFRNPEMMERGIDALRIDNMWETNYHISGVPPHVKDLSDLAELKEQLSAAVESIFTRIMEGTTHYFETRRIGGGDITEERLMELIQNASDTARSDIIDKLRQQLQSLFDSCRGPPEQAEINAGVETASSTSKELPKDFEFPSSTTLDLWKKWNTGNTVRRIPQLKDLRACDFKFLDKTPLTIGEEHRQKHTTNAMNDDTNEIIDRRPACKFFWDMKFICEHIEEEAILYHGFSEISPSNMLDAFKAVTSDWDIPINGKPKPKRFEHQAWRSAIRIITARKKAGAQHSQVEPRTTPTIPRRARIASGTAPTVPRRAQAASRTAPTIPQIVLAPTAPNIPQRAQATNRGPTQATRTKYAEQGTQQRNPRNATGPAKSKNYEDRTGTFEEAFRDVPLHVEKTLRQEI